MYERQQVGLAWPRPRYRNHSVRSHFLPADLVSMPVKEFIKDGVEKFAVENMDRSAFIGDHWTFIHIPKTAGSSFREDIADIKQPSFNIKVDYYALDPKNSRTSLSIHLGWNSRGFSVFRGGRVCLDTVSLSISGSSAGLMVSMPVSWPCARRA